jgi:ACR3 family arsenite efflux pump ArsB
MKLQLICVALSVIFASCCLAYTYKLKDRIRSEPKTENIIGFLIISIFTYFSLIQIYGVFMYACVQMPRSHNAVCYDQSPSLFLLAIAVALGFYGFFLVVGWYFLRGFRPIE